MDIYVSTNGRDTNAGTKDAPFGSFVRAREEARKYTGAVVHIEAGRYFIRDTIELDERDSNTVYSASGEVIFDGGIVLNNADIQDYQGSIKMVDLRPYGVRLGEYGERGFDRNYINAPNELFVDSKPYAVARYPKEGRVIYQEGDILDPGSIPRRGDYACKSAVIRLGKELVRKWADAKDAYIGGCPCWSWADECLKIESFDSENGTVKTKTPAIFGFGANGQSGWYVVNLLEELTQPGEYYVDKNAQKLYFIPEYDVADSFLQLSVLDKVMLAIEGAENLTIEGITFENSRNSGIYIERGNSVKIRNCVFRNLGILAVQIGQGAQPQPHGRNNGRGDREAGVPEPKPIAREMGSWTKYIYEFAAWDNFAGENHCVENCKIYDTGCGGILLSGGNRKTLKAGNNKVYNCEITRVNRLDLTYKAAVNIMGVGNKIEHCEIYDLPHFAIYLHGNDHLIEYNKIHDVVKKASDAGAFYMGRDASEVGNILRYNYFAHIRNHIKNSKTERSAGVTAIYFDDFAIYNTVYGNYFYDIKCGGTSMFTTIHHNNGGLTTIANNFFIDCEPALNPGSRSNGHHFMHHDEVGRIRAYTPDAKDLRGVDVTSEIWREKYPYLFKTYTEDYNPGNKYWHNLTHYKQSDYWMVDPEHENFEFKEGCEYFNWGGEPFRIVDREFGLNNEARPIERVAFGKIGLIPQSTKEV